MLASQVQHAWDMPENTLGGAYAKFMGDRNFSPDDRPPVRFLENEEVAYVAQRAREVLLATIQLLQLSKFPLLTLV